MGFHNRTFDHKQPHPRTMPHRQSSTSNFRPTRNNAPRRETAQPKERPPIVFYLIFIALLSCALFGLGH